MKKFIAEFKVKVVNIGVCQCEIFANNKEEVIKKITDYFNNPFDEVISKEEIVIDSVDFTKLPKVHLYKRKIYLKEI